jgi:hypothetical protein
MKSLNSLKLSIACAMAGLSTILPALAQGADITNDLLLLRWVQGRSNLGGNAMSHNLIDATAGDFNGDGFDDILTLSPTKLRIAWNGPEGLENFEVVQEASGEWRGLAWDPTSQTLWLTCAFPDRVECWHFQDQTLDVDHSFSGLPTSMRVCPGHGLVALQRKNDALELLTPDGEASALIPDASSLSDATLVRSPMAEGPDILVMQDKFTGRLGTSTGSLEKWSDVSWWNETESTDRWHIQWTEQESIQVLGSAQCVWFKELNAKGNVINEWTSKISFFNDCDYWFIPSKNPHVIELVERSPISYTTNYVVLDANDGQPTSKYVLAELDHNPALLTPDLDGDGMKDIMYPLHDGQQWEYHVSWSAGTRKLYWKDSKVQTGGWNLPFEIPQPWLDAIGDPSRVLELWTHDGKLLVQRRDGWHTIEAVDEMRNVNVAPTASEPQGPFCHQLDIDYLELGLTKDQGEFSGIAEITPHQWHHLVFMRKANLQSEVWLDGTCLFRGKSTDRRYHYNAILFGASYHRKNYNWAGVSLDRVILSGKHWTEEDILTEFHRQDPPPPAYVVEQWDFESMPLVGTKSNVPLGGNSQPKLVQGIDGNALSFDGLDDTYRTYVKVPTDNLTLSFFFRLDDPSITSSQSMATLYGMYNTNISLVWRPRSSLIQPKLENSPLETPTWTEETPLNLPRGTNLHLQADALLALTPEGEVWMEGPLGWQKHVDSSPSMALPVGKPWSKNDGLNCLDATGGHWRWQAEEGWTQHGYEQWEGAKILESSRFGAFVNHDDGWLWFEKSEEESWVPQDSISAPTMFAWTPVGDMVHLGEAGWFGWQPSRRNLTMMLGRPFVSEHGFQSRLGWLLGITVVLLVGGVWIIRRTSNNLSGFSEEAWTVPTDLFPTLGRLVVLGQITFDTVSLDDAIGSSDYDTDETRRARRSRFIKDCNAWGLSLRDVEVIQRGKDPHDRRRTMYKIHDAWFDDLDKLMNQTPVQANATAEIPDPKQGHDSEA